MISIENNQTFSTFSTAHFDVHRYISECADPDSTYHYYKAYTREPEGAAVSREVDGIFIGSVKLEVIRKPGPSRVMEIVFKDYGSGSHHWNGERWEQVDIDRSHDWRMEEFLKEFLLGIRERVGPLSLDLINYDWFDDDVILLFHSPRWPEILRNGTGYPMKECGDHYHPLLARLQAVVGEEASDEVTSAARDASNEATI